MTQTTMRSAVADVYHNDQTFNFQPMVEMSLPAGPYMGAFCDALLEAWHAVEIEEDLSTMPEIYDYDKLNTVDLRMPRLKMTIHMDGSTGAREVRDEESSCMVLNIMKLHYRREWDPPNVSAVRQIIRIQELSLWDFSRHAGTPNRQAQASRYPDGLCMMLISAHEKGRSEDAYKDGLLIDMVTQLDATEVCRRPYSAAPPYAWPRLPKKVSKRQKIRMTCFHFCPASDFLDQIFQYCSHLEASLGPSNVLGPKPNDRIIPAETDMVLDNVRFVLPAGPTVTSTALMLRMRRLVIAGELTTMELAIIPVASTVFAAKLNLDSGPFCVFTPQSVEQVISPFTADLAIRINEESPHRRVLLGSLPVLEMDLTPETGALMWMIKDLFSTNPFLMSRVDPDFAVPSKWDLAVDIAGIEIVMYGSASRGTPLARIILQQIAFSRDFKTDVLTIESIEITSPAVADSAVASIGDDERTAMVMTVRKNATPTTMILIDAMIMRVTDEFLTTLLEFHDLGMAPTSAARTAFRSLKADALQYGPGSHMHGHAWGTARGNVVLATCARPTLFKAASYVLKDVQFTFVDVAQMRVSHLEYSKSRPDGIAQPTLVSKKLVIESWNVWSLAGMDYTVGTWIAEDKLPRILHISSDESHEAGIHLEINETLAPSMCPWMSQQPLDNVGPTSLTYHLRAGSITFSLQNEFLDPMYKFFDGVETVVDLEESKAAVLSPARSPRRGDTHSPRKSGTYSPRRGRPRGPDSPSTSPAIWPRNGSLGSDKNNSPMRSFKLDGSTSPGSSDSYRLDPMFDSADFEVLVDETPPVLLDIEVGTFQIAVPVGFQEVVRRSQTNLNSVPERHALLVAVDNIYAIGSLAGEMQFGTEARLQSGFIGGGSSTPKQSEPISVLRLAQQIIQPVTIAGTVSFCDDVAGEERWRVLRADIPQVSFTANEMQYAVMLGVYDILFATPMYTRKAAAPVEEKTKSRRSVDIEVGIEGVWIDLTAHRTGESVCKINCSTIDIGRFDDHVLVHLGKILAVTECLPSFSSRVMEFPLLNTSYCKNVDDGKGDDAGVEEEVPVCFCRISLQKKGQQPTLNVRLGDIDFTVMPEFVKAVVDYINTTKQHYSSLIQSKADIEAALVAAATAPRKTDIVLTDNDVVTEDLTLSPSCRLFFRPTSGNNEIKLTGNGFSLRFEGAETGPEDMDEALPMGQGPPAAFGDESPPLLFIPAGVTLYLVDMVLENFQTNAVSLGDNAQVKGVVTMANPVTKVSLRGSRANQASPFARRLTRSISVTAVDEFTPLSYDGKSPLSSPIEWSIGDASGDRSSLSDIEDILSPGQDSAFDQVPVKKEMLVLHLYSERIDVHILDSVFTEASQIPKHPKHRRGNSSLSGVGGGSTSGASGYQSGRSGTGSVGDGGSSYLSDGENEDMDGVEIVPLRTSRGLTRLASPSVAKPRLSKLKLSRIGASSDGASPGMARKQATSYSTFDIGFKVSLHVKPTQKNPSSGMNISQDLNPKTKSDINIKVQATNVVASTTTRMEEDGSMVSRAEIIAPSGVMVEVCVEEDLETYEIDILIEPVQLIVAFSTIQLGILFGRMYASMLKETKPEGAIPLPPPVKTTQEDTKRSIRLSCPFLSAQLIDDSQALVFPLLQFSVNEVDLATGIHRGKVGEDDDEEYTQSMLTFVLSADSMNQALVEWEPIVEPCAFVVEAVVFVEPKTAASIVGDTEVAISATEALNVNVTRNLLLAMQTAVENWKAVAAGPRLAISNTETDYKLRNETQNSVTLWLSNEGAEGLQDKVLATGEELAFSLAARGTIKRDDTMTSRSQILVGIPGFKPVAIDVDRIGFETYQFSADNLRQSTGKKKGNHERAKTIHHVTIACNLFLDGPTKVASLRAVLFVENDTEDPIHLTTKEPAGDDDDDMVSGEFFSIRPGGGASIDATTRIVWLRPDSRYKWTQLTVPTRAKDGAWTEKVHVVSRAINMAAGIMAYSTTATNTNGAVSLHVMPTLAIHNRLPCIMNARVYRYLNTGKTAATIPGQKIAALTADSQALVWEGSLRPGEASCQCFGSPTDHLLLSLTVDGFTWSTPVIVESPVHFLAKGLELTDANRRVLTLGIDNRTGTEERCFRSVAVFCSCWIVNLTGLPLVYSGTSLGIADLARDSTRGTATAAGEPVDGNTSRRPVLIGWQRASFKVADTTASGDTASIGVIGETAETEWSKPFSTTAIRTSGVSSVTEKEDGSFSKEVRQRVPSGSRLHFSAPT